MIRTLAAPPAAPPRRAPIPREHGAWVMLYAPLALGLVAGRAHRALPALLLVAAATFAFFAQESARRLLRGRGDDSTARWLALFAGAAGAAGLPLLALTRPAPLLAVGGAAAALFAVQAALLRRPARKRADRTLGGELLAVPALALTGPAAAVVAGAGIGTALAVWVLYILFFSSGIFVVKMLLASARFKGGLSAAERRQVGRPALLFHALLALAVTAAAVALGLPAGALLALAFLPALVRTALVWRRLDGTLPSLKRVGMRETALALWFAALAAAALRTLH